MKTGFQVTIKSEHKDSDLAATTRSSRHLHHALASALADHHHHVHPPMPVLVAAAVTRYWLVKEHDLGHGNAENDEFARLAESAENVIRVFGYDPLTLKKLEDDEA